jgi:flagellar basal body rod protein FlgC
MNLTSIALEGLRKAEQKLEKSGRELARQPVAAEAEAEDRVNWSDSMAGLIEARHLYEANLRLVSAEDELCKHTIDLIG